MTILSSMPLLAFVMLLDVILLLLTLFLEVLSLPLVLTLAPSLKRPTTKLRDVNNDCPKLHELQLAARELLKSWANTGLNRRHSAGSSSWLLTSPM